MRQLLIILASLAAYGQATTPYKVAQSSGSAAGALWLQEPRASGTNWFKLRAGAMSADVSAIAPIADGLPGQCLQTDGSGQWGWAACIINGGNTTGATLTIGTNDAQTLSLETNGTVRWSIPITGHLYAGANNTSDIGAGLSANSPRSIYAATSMVTPKIGRDSSASLTIMTDSADRWSFTSAGMITPAVTDTYDIGNLTTPLRVRGIYGKIVDTALAGGTGDYLQTRKLQLFDNTGSSTGASYWDLNVVMSGVGAGQNSYFYLRDNAGSNVFKSERIASGVAVSRTTWYTDLLPDTDGGRSMGTQLLNWDKVYANQLGDSSYPVVVWGANSDFSGLTTTALTINTGAATVGYVWTATSTGGAGSWQAASGGLPVVDTTGIAKGSSDATKIVRFEVDGFTSGVTNVLTPQNNSYTLAGTNIAQTFSSTQTFSGTLAVSGRIGDDFIPNIDGTYVNGTTSFRWGSIATYNADFNGVLALQSGSTITGSILPTFNNLYALGNTSYRMSNVATVNINFSGTVTAPNGNTGLSSTRTVGDGSGGSCTITISGGIITDSTCP
jgi:hypothetical protein